MKYCIYCGNILENNDKFCSKCGNFQTNEKKPNTYYTQSHINQSKSNKTETKTIIIVISIVVVIVLSLVLGYFFILKDNGEDNSLNNDNNDEYNYEDDYDYGNDDAYLGDYGYDEYAEDFIFYDSSSRYLTYGEIEYLDEEDCQQAINEIYARHGRIFSEEPYASYFKSCEWYQPIYSGDGFDESVFNDYEKENLSLLVDLRKEISEYDEYDEYDEY